MQDQSAALREAVEGSRRRRQLRALHRWRSALSDRTKSVYALIPRWVKISATFAIIAAIAFGGGAWTFSLGRFSIEKFARTNGLCKLDGCADGIERVESVLSERYALSTTTLEWCLGVDEWRHTRVHRGGLFKMILVDVLDTPCGSLKPTSDP